MEKAIRFNAHFGDDIRKVEIKQIEYTGPHWHVYIEGIEVAEIFLRQGFYWYHDDDLYSDDVQALVDRITDYLKVPWQQAQFYTFAVRSEAFKKKAKPLLS